MTKGEKRCMICDKKVSLCKCLGGPTLWVIAR